MNKTLMTDFYELTMAQTYFNENKQNEEVYFNIFFRKNPFDGGYTISGGLEEIINYIENFKFGDKEIKYLRSLNCFTNDFLDYLKNMKFSGDIYAVKDGTVVFPNEPVITVKAPIIEAQLLETALLACFNHASLVSTATRRITNEAKNIPVMEFGARRARGIDSAIEASKYSYLAGCVGTSNTYAGMEYGIPVLGTMAHSLVTESENEYEAFLKYAKSNPDNCVFLVDTYDTLNSGLINAIRVANDYLTPNGYKFKGIRIDSGNLVELSKKCREILDAAGYPETKICLSNGLNEYSIKELLANGAVIDSLGIGDNIAASKERMGGVYKLVAVEQNNHIIPRIKVSDDEAKTILPGYKNIYRVYNGNYMVEDYIALHDELDLDLPELQQPTYLQNAPLQKTIYKNGKLVYNVPTIEETKKYSDQQFNSLPESVKDITNPVTYLVEITPQLSELKEKLINKNKVKTLTR